MFSPQATKCVIQTDAPHRKMFGNIITLMANFFPSQINLSSFNLFLLLYSYIAYMYRIWLLVFQFVYMDVSISVGLRCFYAFFYKFVCQVGNVCIEPSRPFFLLSMNINLLFYIRIKAQVFISATIYIVLSILFN